MKKSNSSRNQEYNFFIVIKKASNLDEILFWVLQKSYHAISNLFDIIFSELIKNEYYS